MRLTEYIDFLNREDIGMAHSPKSWIPADSHEEAQVGDYTHFTPFTQHKRARYLHQCHLKGRKPVE